jgi:hypothetical protein
MNKLIVLFAVCYCFSFSQEPIVLKRGESFKADSGTYYIFNRVQAETLAVRLKEYNLLKSENNLLNRKIELLNYNLLLKDSLLVLKDKRIEVYKDILGLQEQLLELEKSYWWDRFYVGAVVGVIGTVGLVYLTARTLESIK